MGDYSRSSSFVMPAPRDDAFSLFSQNLSRPSWLPLHSEKQKKDTLFQWHFLTLSYSLVRRPSTHRETKWMCRCSQ